ncbi:Forkhead-associated (FHA) domain [Macleaya cordata]|uniref:Forkhead-associated (FHA) domain n=1 Tax=Macleaya cordata TaxID=56857 RepID=A0A200QIM8_MACCD|nr:Forkhead-associated (FHA) domain [Macleaya cordata]
MVWTTTLNSPILDLAKMIGLSTAEFNCKYWGDHRWGLQHKQFHCSRETVCGQVRTFNLQQGTPSSCCCDVIINTDKGVSRIHAEVVVHSMTSLDALQRKSSNFSSDVHVKDCSKYGTFINKKLGSKSKVHEYPNKEITLKDGDLISFGTGNATYRFCFVPLIFFVYCSKLSKVDPSFQDQISSIGACATQNWSAECTHALVDDSAPVKEDLIDAIVSQKPVILNRWVKVVAEKNISTEIPSFADYVPTLTLNGFPVKVVDPKAREKCLAGYTFLFGELYLYKFGDKLQSLLDLGGSKFLSIDEFSSSSQASEDGANNRVVLVVPAGSINQFNAYQHLRSLSRVNDVNLISAILSGHLDPSIVESPSILVSSSCSTDETIVADSDVEMDTAATHGVAADAQTEAIKHEDEAITADRGNSLQEDKAITTGDHAKSQQEDEAITTAEHANSPTKKFQLPSLKVVDGIIIEKRDKGDESDTSVVRNSDIIYSQDLIVRDTNPPALVRSSTVRGVVNFKRFRRREMESGNSFKDLIPFSKYPYRESEYGSEEVAEHVKEEKKRKQMEAIAEDLFNNDKARRRGAAGSSIRELLTRA